MVSVVASIADVSNQSRSDISRYPIPGYNRGRVQSHPAYGFRDSAGSVEVMEWYAAPHD